MEAAPCSQRRLYAVRAVDVLLAPPAMNRRMHLIAVAVCSMSQQVAACRCKILLVRGICNGLSSTKLDTKSSSAGVHTLESSCRCWWTLALNIRKNTGFGAANLRAAPHMWRNEGCMFLHFQSYRKQFLDLTPTPLYILAPLILHPRSHCLHALRWSRPHPSMQSHPKSVPSSWSRWNGWLGDMDSVFAQHSSPPMRNPPICTDVT